ncbi:D-glycero-D-manno-heptose 1,7-bisphosphate phosphatase [Streptomyces tendae]
MSTADNPVKAVLFDRDGTLVHDVPYNGDPERVRPVDGAREAVALLRAHGIRVGVVTNQSGVARGLISDRDVRRVNRRVDDLIGPFDVWAVCPHGPDDGCHCRKPQPGMILWAAGRVCAGPADCVVVGDIGADMEAAERAGARGILVPNDRTRPEETAAAAHVAPDLLTAARAILNGPPTGRIPVNERPVEAAYGPGAENGPRSAAPADGDRSGPVETASPTSPGRGVFGRRGAAHRPAREGPPSEADSDLGHLSTGAADRASSRPAAHDGSDHDDGNDHDHDHDDGSEHHDGWGRGAAGSGGSGPGAHLSIRGRGEADAAAADRAPEVPAVPDTRGGASPAEHSGAGPDADERRGGPVVAPDAGRTASPDTVRGPGRGGDAPAAARSRTAPAAGAVRTRGVGDRPGRST